VKSQKIKTIPNYLFRQRIILKISHYSIGKIKSKKEIGEVKKQSVKSQEIKKRRKLLF